eukprot:c4413_g1_i1.p1 GENE.c4413_g1_i1~~c4413_g1_i1.p1  ORF type:complete len:127 (-),score=26.72 c4413_g1_i1:20-400(-)
MFARASLSDIRSSLARLSEAVNQVQQGEESNAPTHYHPAALAFWDRHFGRSPVAPPLDLGREIAVMLSSQQITASERVPCAMLVASSLTCDDPVGVKRDNFFKETFDHGVVGWLYNVVEVRQQNPL